MTEALQVECEIGRNGSPALSESYLHALINSIADPIFVKDRDHRFVLVNDAFCRFAGRDRSDFQGTTAMQLIRQDEASSFHRNDEMVFGTGQENVSEESVTDPQGVTHFISTKKTLYVNESGQRFIVGIIRDITERKQTEERLRQLAFYDPLTGLANRTLFEERLQKAIESAFRSKKSVALLLLDLDRLKLVNDTLGHHGGDRLLVEVARRIQANVGAADSIARFAGDVFVCLFENVVDPASIKTVAERIARAVRSPFLIDGTKIHISASIGIASCASDDCAEDLLRFAGVAMRRAKHAGGAGVEVFDLAIDSAATKRLHVQNELRHALRRQELRVFYQPFVLMGTRRIWGAEALVRWQHPTRGLIAPSEFIPLAEESGLIVPLGEWVLRQACRELAEWRSRGWADDSFTLSVNLSARQLEDPTLVDVVREVLAETRIPAQCLVLEITENVLLQSTARAHDLRRLGVRLAIDDFGTGYASLAYLKDLPVDVLKVARNFTSTLGEDRAGDSIVRTIMTLARFLRLTCIAEGIETDAQARLLKRMRCQIGQGFLFAKPMPVDDFVRWLRADHSTAAGSCS